MEANQTSGSEEPWGHKVAVDKRPRLVAYFARRLRRKNIANDLAQDAIVAFLETRGRTKDGAPITDPVSYLWGIAHLILRQAKESTAPKTESDENYDARPKKTPPPVDLTQLFEQERVLETKRLLLAIARDRRNTYLLQRVLGRSDAAIVAERGGSAGALRVHVHTRRDRLRAERGEQAKDVLVAA